MLLSQRLFNALSVYLHCKYLGNDYVKRAQPVLSEKGRCEADLWPFSQKHAVTGWLGTGLAGRQPAEQE